HVAETFTRVAAQHDEAPRLQLAVIRRAHRRAEDLAKRVVIGRRLGELRRAAAGGQGIDCIHQGTISLLSPSLAWPRRRPTWNRPKGRIAKPIRGEGGQAAPSCFIRLCESPREPPYLLWAVRPIPL